MARLTALKPRLKAPGARHLATPAEQARTRGGKWMRARERVLSANPLCVVCDTEGRVSVATEVDHKTPLDLGGTDDEANLQGLCHDCHAKKTTAEQRARHG